MSFVQKSVSAIGRLMIVAVLAATFMAGVLGVGYLQLKGEEIQIPKVVGKNFNLGGEELASHGLRIKKIASRYSEDAPNTILEQRPRAGTTAKTGLMISVVVSQPNPDGSEAPADVKDDDEAIEEIEDLPELKTDKAKKKSKTKPKKTSPKTRDVIEEGPEIPGGDKPSGDTPAGGDLNKTSNPTDTKTTGDKKTGTDKKVQSPPNTKPEKVVPKPPVKPKDGGDIRQRKAGQSN